MEFNYINNFCNYDDMRS